MFNIACNWNIQYLKKKLCHLLIILFNLNKIIDLGKDTYVSYKNKYKNKNLLKISYDDYVCAPRCYIEVIPSHAKKYCWQMFVYCKKEYTNCLACSH